MNFATSESFKTIRIENHTILESKMNTFKINNYFLTFLHFLNKTFGNQKLF